MNQTTPFRHAIHKWDRRMNGHTYGSSGQQLPRVQCRAVWVKFHGTIFPRRNLARIFADTPDFFRTSSRGCHEDATRMLQGKLLPLNSSLLVEMRFKCVLINFICHLLIFMGRRDRQDLERVMQCVGRPVGVSSVRPCPSCVQAHMLVDVLRQGMHSECVDALYCRTSPRTSSPPRPLLMQVYTCMVTYGTIAIACINSGVKGARGNRVCMPPSGRQTPNAIVTREECL